MKKHLVEPTRRTPVSGSYDVLVVGGGVAGVAAAVAAARSGATVGLVEKTCTLGGLATLANVVIYLPLCDGRGNQVIKGLGEEFLKLSIRDGHDHIPECWLPGGRKEERYQHRYRVRFNPASYALALEELLVNEGVSIHYDTRFCDVRRGGRRIEGVFVENKNGRSALLARMFVDASGDADVCARAGEKTVSLRTNTLSGWYFYGAGPNVRFSQLHVPFDADGRVVPDGGRGYAGDRADDVTQFVLGTNQLIRKDLARRSASAEERVRPLILPTIPSFRMTRRLKGRVELERADDRNRFPDSVGMTGDWRRAGPVYYLPFRALVGVATDNLVTAGRCISAASAWDLTRAIPTCVVTGQAAGAAAALAVTFRQTRLADLDTRALQAHLRSQKALLLKRIPPDAESPAS